MISAFELTGRYKCIDVSLLHFPCQCLALIISYRQGFALRYYIIFQFKILHFLPCFHTFLDLIQQLFRGNLKVNYLTN